MILSRLKYCLLPFQLLNSNICDYDIVSRLYIHILDIVKYSDTFINQESVSIYPPLFKFIGIKLQILAYLR